MKFIQNQLRADINVTELFVESDNIMLVIGARNHRKCRVSYHEAPHIFKFGFIWRQTKELWYLKDFAWYSGII